jgi:oligopeptide transport system ATP-binding protein
MKTDNDILVKIENLVMHFPIYRGVIRRQVGAVRAVDGVSLEIRQGETLGLVGESGCGKTTVGRTILQLYKPTSGHVYYKGTDLAKLKPEPMRLMRKDLQMIFQDPYASLNPRMTVRDIIGDPMFAFGEASGKQIDEATSRFPPWMFPSRPRWSTCWKTCSATLASPTSSSRTTFPWCATSATASR